MYSKNSQVTSVGGQLRVEQLQFHPSSLEVITARKTASKTWRQNWLLSSLKLPFTAFLILLLNIKKLSIKYQDL